jgi:ParB-like chromosome segregation protein Spo0J
MRVIEIELDQIKVEERRRRDLGNLDALAESIKRVGLLKPITVDRTKITDPKLYRLFAGERRRRAALMLGWKTIPAHVMDRLTDERMRDIELEENENRIQSGRMEVEQQPMKVIDVPINNIHIGDRHRRDMGDMETLAANIREMGLLQPIGIDEYFNLVYGMRRLEACENLGWKRIPCIVVKLKSILAGEWAENEMRKQFTPTERAAIGRAIEEELGNRQGQRTDLGPIAPKSKGRTADIAATRAGFADRKSYERAQTVVERGAPELIVAMDKGEIKIDAAAKIATQPKADQKRIVAMPIDERREVVRQIRKTKASREADERRARDILIFRGLYDALKLAGAFHEDAKETWAGMWRVSAYDFGDHLTRAREAMARIDKERPNEPQKPTKVS